ncbi:hypothetical protein COOONC_02585 [Cooperia oncophora]
MFQEHVEKYKVGTIFRFVDITLVLYTAQMLLIFQPIFLGIGIIDCGPILSALNNVKFIYNFALICEMTLLSLLATRLLLPEKSELFDRSPQRLMEIARNTQEKMLT